jgi:hypothetical protein
MLHILNRTKCEGARPFHTTQNGAQFQTCKLFISGIFHLIFLNLCWPWVAKTIESENMNKGVTNIYYFPSFYRTSFTIYFFFLFFSFSFSLSLSWTRVWTQVLHSHLQSRPSIAKATPPVHFALVILKVGSHKLFAWIGLKSWSSWFQSPST